MMRIGFWARAAISMAAMLVLAVAVRAESPPKDPPKPGSKEEPKPMERPAIFELRVPPTATVEINEHKTTSTGEFRRFESPPLPIGKDYTYHLVITWREQTVKKDITVSPDRIMAYDFRGEFRADSTPLMPRMRLELPASIDLKAGDKKEFMVKINRANVKGDVVVKFSGMPKGLTIADVTIPADKDSAIAEAVVDADANAARSAITASATSGEVRTSAQMTVRIAAKVPLPPEK